MKKLILCFMILAVAPLSLKAQQVIQSFDTQLDSTYWVYENNGLADADLSYIIQYVNDDDFVEGTGCMEVQYSAHNTETWGGYTEIWHLVPGSEVYDFSAYDSISFWYNNVEPATLPDRMHLRFHLYDVSNASPNVRRNSQCEYYYSFHYILDNEPGWHEIVMPLVDGRNDPALDEWNGEAFNRTGWAGIVGNDQLDPVFIKGYAFELNINGTGSGDFVEGVVLFDGLMLKGPNGTAVKKSEDVLRTFELKQNYPNPFNPSTTIEYALPAQSKVRLNVYDILGNEVAQLVNEVKSAGVHSVVFDGSALASGLYFYTLDNGSAPLIGKMMLVK